LLRSTGKKTLFSQRSLRVERINKEYFKHKVEVGFLSARTPEVVIEDVRKWRAWSRCYYTLISGREMCSLIPPRIKKPVIDETRLKSVTTAPVVQELMAIAIVSYQNYDKLLTDSSSPECPYDPEFDLLTSKNIIQASKCYNLGYADGEATLDGVYEYVEEYLGNLDKYSKHQRHWYDKGLKKLEADMQMVDKAMRKDGVK
jgi:hypothetical protein